MNLKASLKVWKKRLLVIPLKYKNAPGFGAFLYLLPQKSQKIIVEFKVTFGFFFTVFNLNLNLLSSFAVKILKRINLIKNYYPAFHQLPKPSQYFSSEPVPKAAAPKVH